MVTVTVVVTLFLYFIFQAGLDRSGQTLPDFSWLSTRNLSVFVRPEEDTALIRPAPSPCQPRRADPAPRLLIAVFSAPANAAARAVIRKTWGGAARGYPGTSLVFMLGRAGQPDMHVSTADIAFSLNSVFLQKSVVQEAEDHNDLVLEDFHDTYLNLTLKTTFLLKWLGAECKLTKFVLKVDDDVFVNMERLWATLGSSHLFSTMVNLPGERSAAPVPTNIDYALIGHVMNTVPIR